jgi:hypothetical protein
VSSFLLTLDTTPPVVTFGPVTDANAGEEMSVEYLVSEPGIDHATVTLLDSRVLPMVDTGTALTVELPADAPQGQAVVRAYARDDVDNTAEYALELAITGVLPPTPTDEPPRPGWPQPQVVRVVSAPSRGRAASTYSISAYLTTTSTGRARSMYVVPGTTRRLRFGDRLNTSSTYRSRAVIDTASTATTAASATVTKRPEGPGHEEELIFLDLL